MNNPSLEEVLIECAFHLGKGVGDTEIKQEAIDLWMSAYRTSFAVALGLPGAYWQRDKRKVLPMAVKLGRVAVALADGDPITADIAERASDIIKVDPACPTPILRGKYCA